jgi:hypothetical protein
VQAAASTAAGRCVKFVLEKIEHLTRSSVGHRDLITTSGPQDADHSRTKSKIKNAQECRLREVRPAPRAAQPEALGLCRLRGGRPPRAPQGLS